MAFGVTFVPELKAIESRHDRFWRSSLIRFTPMMLCWALALQAIGLSALAGADDPVRSSSKDDAPFYIFLETATDLDALRKKLGRPDFVILKGPLYDQLKDQAKPSVSLKKSVVESVAVSGEILDDLAHLKVDFQISQSGPEPTWVPIRLDGQIVTSAREGDRDLPIRSADGGWQVRVEGNGPHRVQVELSSVVLSAKGGASGRRLGWAIPEAGSTRLQVSLPPNTSDFSAITAGQKEPLVAESIEGAQRHRVSAYLTPRRNLELQWNVAADVTSEGPPIITAQGEIALDIERGSMTAKSSWEVRSKRGTVRRLELRIDPADELVGLECDGRPVAGGEPRDAASGLVVVPLSKPLAADESCRLVITTRRALSPESSTRLTYRGLPLLNVVSQMGVLAISQSGGDPWVTASPGRGLRAIDPRSELPASLRARPSIVLAYQFVEQPFDLGLQVDPSPPEVRVESRTTIAIDSRTAKVDSVLDYTVARGRVFEVRVSLPESFQLDSVGSESVVLKSQTLPGTAAERPSLVVRLTSKATEEGRFSLRLQGRQTIALGSTSVVGLPRALDARVRGGLLAILAARETTVELAPPTPGRPSDFVTSGLEVPASWPWPAGVEAASVPPALWLRHDESPTSISLVVFDRKRVLRQDTTLDAVVDRRKVDIRQETLLRGRFGPMSSVDLSVPREIVGSWEVEGVEVVRRDTLGVGRDGSERYRLMFGRPILDREPLRFRITQAWKSPLVAEHLTSYTIRHLTILDAESSPIRVRVGADEGIDIAGQQAGWTSVESDLPTGSVARIEKVSEGSAIVGVTAHAFATLPRTIASRLALISSQQSDGGLQTSASYRLETHTNSLLVILPPGAEWIRARVGSETVDEVEQVASLNGAYRLKLPTDSSGPLVVTLDYSQTAKDVTTSGSWGAPRLGDGVIVQESTWEIRVPGQVAVLGVPMKWSDLNRWEWATYVFVRRPATTRTGPADGVSHAYLFGRIGEPVSISPFLLSRANLVGISSGLVLALGLLAMSLRGASRLFAGILVFTALVAVVAVPPSVIPQLAQASALGFFLLLVAETTRLLLERRSPLPRLLHEPSGLQIGSASSKVGDANADGSTVVRARAGTTVDRIPVEASDGAAG